jgi:hypothetical protein
MAVTLPSALALQKDSGSTFTCNLLVFHLKTGDLRVTNLDVPVTWDGLEFLSVPLEVGKASSSDDSKIDDVTITVSNIDDSFTAALFSGYRFSGCAIEVYEVAYPEILTDPTQAQLVNWGYLDTPLLKGKEATFEVTLKAYVPNQQNSRTFQLSCNSEFADGETCMATADVSTGTVQGGTTVHTIIIQQSHEDNYWQNGIIHCGAESRMVASSTGNTIRLHYPFSVQPTGGYTVERGCDKSKANCKLHGQLMNYSGFPSIPRELVIKG